LQAATDVTGFALAKTDVTRAMSDGTITATLYTCLSANDNPVYTYAKRNNSGISSSKQTVTQDSQLFSGLAIGTYGSGYFK
jgi:hypothetical protein